MCSLCHATPSTLTCHHWYNNLAYLILLWHNLACKVWNGCIQKHSNQITNKNRSPPQTELTQILCQTQNLGIDSPLPNNNGVNTSNEGPGASDFNPSTHHNHQSNQNSPSHTQNSAPPQVCFVINLPRSPNRTAAPTNHPYDEYGWWGHLVCVVGP